MEFLEYFDDYIKVREATKQGYAIAKGGDSINLEQPNSKTRRGRVGKQIANTLTCSCNQGVVVEEMQKIITAGNYSPSNHNVSRIVSANGLAPTAMENHGTVTAVALMEKDVYLSNGAIRGRYNGKGKIEQKLELRNDGVTNTLTTVEKDNVIVEECELKGGENVWKNELEKFEFKMDNVRLFDSFAGIGALHQSLKELGVPTDVVGLSEIDIDAIISYAAIHIENFKDLEFEYPSEDEMREFLINRNIGYSFEKGKSSIPRLKKDKLYKVYKASVVLNNLGDISKLNYDNIPDFDLFNFSFPCTDISNAGKQKGFKNEDGSVTRSGLYVFGIDVIKAKKPKYVMIENVKGLITKKFIHKFYDMVEEIESLGYKCYYPTKEVKKSIMPTCLNSKDFGVAQNRERIFVICVRKDADNGFEFPQGFDNGVRLKHMLEDNVDEKYYLSQDFMGKFISNKNFSKEETSNSDNKIKDVGFIQKGETRGKHQMKTLTSVDYKSPQLITKKETNLRIRKITPLECWRLMGFDDEDFYKVKELGLSDSALYKMAGNSIVVNCLYYQFKNLFKNYIVK